MVSVQVESVQTRRSGKTEGLSGEAGHSDQTSSGTAPKYV